MKDEEIVSVVVSPVRKTTLGMPVVLHLRHFPST